MKSERFETWEYNHTIKLGPEGEEQEYGPFHIHIDISCQEFYLEDTKKTVMFGPKCEVHPYADDKGLAPMVEEIVFEIKGKKVDWMPRIEETIEARIESEKKKKKKGNLSKKFTAQDAVQRAIWVFCHWDESLVVTDPSTFTIEPGVAPTASTSKDESDDDLPTTPLTDVKLTDKERAEMYTSGELHWDDPVLDPDAEDIAFKETTGAIKHLRNGRLHNEQGPAIYTNDWMTYYLFGKYFSKGDYDKVMKRLEAIRTSKQSPPTNGGWEKHTAKDGVSEYKLEGKLHRLNGPAYVDKHRNVEKYYIQGKEYAKEDYWKIIEQMSRRKAIAKMINETKKTVQTTGASSTTHKSQTGRGGRSSGKSGSSSSSSSSSSRPSTSSKGMSRHGKPVVWITPLAWQKISYWSYLGGLQSQEVTSFGRTIRDKRGRIRVIDAYLIEQTGTSGSVDGDDSSINKLMVELFKEHGIDPSEAFGTWIHSHPGTGQSATYLSSTDEENIDRILNDEYLVSIVLDQVGESPYCRVDVKNPRLSFECELKVEVPGQSHRWRELDGDAGLEKLADLSDLKAEFEEKVESGYTGLLGYGGYGGGSYRTGRSMYSSTGRGRYDDVEYDMATGRTWVAGSRGLTPDRDDWSASDEERLWQEYLDQMEGEDDDVPSYDFSGSSSEESLAKPFLIAGDEGWLDEEVSFTKGLLSLTPGARKEFVESMSMMDAAAVEEEVIESTCEELATGRLAEAEAVSFVSYVCSVSKDQGKKMLETALMDNGFVDTSSFKELTNDELLGVPKEISEREDRTDRVEVIEIES